MAEAMVKPQRGRSLLKSLAIVATAFLAGCQTLVPKGPPPVETTAPPPETRPPVEPGFPTASERKRVALLVPLPGTKIRRALGRRRGYQAVLNSVVDASRTKNTTMTNTA